MFSNLHQAAHLLSDVPLMTRSSGSDSHLSSTQTSSSSILINTTTNSSTPQVQHQTSGSGLDDHHSNMKHKQLMIPLYLPCIELGLELCAYASKSRIAVLDGGSQGVKKVIVAVCARYTAGIAELFSGFIRV